MNLSNYFLRGGLLHYDIIFILILTHGNAQFASNAQGDCCDHRYRPTRAPQTRVLWPHAHTYQNNTNQFHMFLPDLMILVSSYASVNLWCFSCKYILTKVTCNDCQYIGVSKNRCTVRELHVLQRAILRMVLVRYQKYTAKAMFIPLLLGVGNAILSVLDWRR